jgi:hypothetical protein
MPVFRFGYLNGTPQIVENRGLRLQSDWKLHTRPRHQPTWVMIKPLQRVSASTNMGRCLSVIVRILQIAPIICLIRLACSSQIPVMYHGRNGLGFSITTHTVCV